jgi:hypothetical protein|tara:strand:+ start:507 stop:629 length:123 start_codon:yes stop_codon:yes gene_type:complete
MLKQIGNRYIVYNSNGYVVIITTDGIIARDVENRVKDKKI